MALFRFIAIVCLLAAGGLAACGGEEEPAPEAPVEEIELGGPLEPQQAPASDFAINSGRTLEGSYETTDPAALGMRYVFTADGDFTRIGSNRAGTRLDSGVYIIDGTGRLILYVEERGGERLSAAVPERFELQDRGSEIVLSRAGEAGHVFRKVGTPTSVPTGRVEGQ